MKKITLLVLLIVFTFQFGNSQIDVNFDANATWVGYMSWTGPSGDSETGWAVVDLPAIIDTGANSSTLKPNRVNDLDPYWQTDPETVFGEKIMTASSYVEDPSLAATNFNWVGNVSSFTLDPTWSVSAFIKVFAASYSSLLVETYFPISASGNFSVNYDGTAAAAAIVQYGFVVVGPNVNPRTPDYDTQYDAFGSVGVTPATLGTSEFSINDISVYPNPSKNVWNVKSNNTVINAIQVFDVLGKQVLSLEPRSNNVSIDASELTKGLYFAKIESDTGINSIKLIKN